MVIAAGMVTALEPPISNTLEVEAVAVIAPPPVVNDVPENFRYPLFESVIPLEVPSVRVVVTFNRLLMEGLAEPVNNNEERTLVVPGVVWSKYNVAAPPNDKAEEELPTKKLPVPLLIDVPKVLEVPNVTL